MIDVSNLIKCRFGEFWSVAGRPENLQPLDFSLYNFGGINSTEFLDLGSPDIFVYLLVTEENYIHARAKNIVFNLPWDYKGSPGKLPWGLSLNTARKEFDSIKIEEFLKNTESVPHYEFVVDNKKRIY